MRKKKSALLANRNKSGYLFTAPYIIGMLVLFIPTVVYSLIYSFSKVEIQFDNVATTFVGFKNFTDAFGVDIYFRQYLLDAVRGMLINTVIILLFSFFVANLLNQKFVGRGFARAILFLPVILSTGIVAEADIGNVVSDMFASDSNSADSIATAISSSGFLSAFSLEEIISSIKISESMTNTIIYAIDNTYTIVNHSGVQILIFLSALQSISPSVFEAAKVEGATKWEEFWKITFPILTPMILVTVVYTIVDTFTNPEYKVLTYIQTNAFDNNKLGYASALSWIYFLIILVVLGAVFGIISKRVQYQN